MVEAVDIIQRIALSGQDDVIESFGEIGKAGEEAFAKLAESAGTVGKAFAAVGAAITAAGGALFLWVEHASEAVHSMEQLAQQTGETVENISALQGAIAALGGSGEGLAQAFRRMGQTISREWDQIKKQIEDSADLQISAGLKVEKAQAALFHARDARDKALYGPKAGATAGQLQAENEIEKITELEQAELNLRKAEKEREKERLNAPEAYTAAVKEMITGQKNFAEASKDANLSVDNVIKGIITNTEGAEEAFENFHGNLNDLIGQGPKVLDVFYNLADVMKNSGNAAFNSSLQMRFLGRGMGSDLVTPMHLGSAAMKEMVAAMKEHHLVITDEMMKPALEFHDAYQRLSHDLVITGEQIGLMFAPSFTEGLKDLTGYLETNHEAILAWGQDIADKVTPYVTGFFDALKGLAAYLAGDALDPGSAAGKWEETWAHLANVARTAGKIIRTVLDDIKAAIAAVFGADSNAITDIEALFGGYVAWKLVGKKLATSLIEGFLATLAAAASAGSAGKALETLLAGGGVKAGADAAKGVAAVGGAKTVAAEELPTVLRGLKGVAPSIIGEGVMPIAGGLAGGAAAGAAGITLAGFLTAAVISAIVTTVLLIAAPKVWEWLKGKFTSDKPEIPKTSDTIGLPTDKEQKAADLAAGSPFAEGGFMLPSEEEKDKTALDEQEKKRLQKLYESTDPAYQLKIQQDEQERQRNTGADKLSTITSAGAKEAYDKAQLEDHPGKGFTKDEKSKMLDAMMAGLSADEARGIIKGDREIAAAEAPKKAAQSAYDKLPLGFIRETDLRQGGSMLPYKMDLEIQEQERAAKNAAKSAGAETPDQVVSSLDKISAPADAAATSLGKISPAGDGAVDTLNRIKDIIINAPNTSKPEGKAGGGAVGGWGSGKSDSNLIRASKGEFVVTADGSNLTDALAYFGVRGYQDGGMVTDTHGFSSYMSGAEIDAAHRADAERAKKENARRRAEKIDAINAKKKAITDAEKAKQEEKELADLEENCAKATAKFNSFTVAPIRIAGQTSKYEEEYDAAKAAQLKACGVIDEFHHKHDIEKQLEALEKEKAEAAVEPGFFSENYAEGGVVGGDECENCGTGNRMANHLIRQFAIGGLVGGFADTIANIPGYANGGVVARMPNSSNTLSSHQLDLRTNAGTFSAHVDDDTMDGLRNSSLRTKLSQTGPRPSWYS